MAGLLTYSLAIAFPFPVAIWLQLNGAYSSGYCLGFTPCSLLVFLSKEPLTP